MSENWFNDVFGFHEDRSFHATRNQFHCQVDSATQQVTLCLKSNNDSFHVGKFTMSSVQSLREGLGNFRDAKSDDEGLTFGHLVGVDIRSVIQHPSNAGAVFQVASQFNCLEMVGPGVKPESGVSQYALDPTQGPACALACPAGTVFRNYFASPCGLLKGQAGGDSHQLNGAALIEKLLDNDRHKYWHVTNGYLIPRDNTTMAQVGARIASSGGTDIDSAPLGREIVNALAVGVHWDTEVRCPTKHRVAQVFASAVPVAYCKSTTTTHWAPLASLILEGAYLATLLVGATIAASEKRRVTVYLTNVGGSAFGNMHAWINRAIRRAMEECAKLPLDVRLVHYGNVVPSGSESLGKGAGIRVFRAPFRGLENSGLQRRRINDQEEIAA